MSVFCLVNIIRYIKNTFIADIKMLLNFSMPEFCLINSSGYLKNTFSADIKVLLHVCILFDKYSRYIKNTFSVDIKLLLNVNTSVFCLINVVAI